MGQGEEGEEGEGGWGEGEQVALNHQQKWLTVPAPPSEFFITNNAGELQISGVALHILPPMQCCLKKYCNKDMQLAIQDWF